MKQCRFHSELESDIRMKSAVVDKLNMFFVCFGKSDVCEISGREEEEEDKNCSDIYVCYSLTADNIFTYWCILW